ncbi:GNAT family N-acetyltransferase [Coxiella endosymbiont of Amblyomma nuttalli]|uniref:GNAT family N-acetyltransferase n=1 Tax=Coxiella endosymbiont of Amblyomma nuttalli TaxID=2749996 RepID=UPI001BA68C7F|nr:GNAT family N-acetyltransferase [Coxiella endosymbiont of Amblyomma nuttalli]QTS84097.1 Spermidine N(1)-acetyltransferase [Coxiella endosymbiont of Amblyomma nuttalli]
MISTFYNKKFPILDVDENFFLREQFIKDAEAFFEYYTHPEVTRYILAFNPRNLTEAIAEIHYCRNLFKNECGIYWALARKEDDYMIGAIGLYINNQHDRAEICYDLSHQYWNQGIMTKVIKIVLDFSFHHIPIKQIEAVTLKENSASVTTLRKVGFVYEGSMKNYRYFNGRSYDIEMFTIESRIKNPTKFFPHIGNK